MSQDDTISFSFQGNAVYFIGTTGPNNGNYTVQYDGGEVEMFTANSPNRRSRQMLYTRGNTGPGNHQVVSDRQDPIEVAGIKETDDGEGHHQQAAAQRWRARQQHAQPARPRLYPNRVH